MKLNKKTKKILREGLVTCGIGATLTCWGLSAIFFLSFNYHNFMKQFYIYDFSFHDCFLLTLGILGTLLFVLGIPAVGFVVHITVIEYLKKKGFI